MPDRPPPPPPFLDELVRQLEDLAQPLREARAAAPPLGTADLALMTTAYVAAFREAGWFRHVEEDRLEGLLDVVVVDFQGAPALDVDTEVTGAALIVPGWGVTETDPAAIGRGIAEDEIELLEDARDSGEITGWE